MKKYLLIVTIIFLLLAFSPRVYADTSIWQENFEGDLSSWQVQVPTGCIVQSETVAADKVSPQGGQNLRITNDGTQPECFVARTISSPITLGFVSFWYYDNFDLVNNSTVEVVGMVEDSYDHRMWLGIKSSKSTANYFLSIDDEEVDTQIPRSAGWHKIEFTVSNGQSFAAIDGFILRSRAFSKILREFTKVKFSAGWNARGSARIDGVEVKTLGNEAKEVMTLQTNGDGYSAMFTTKITSLTGQDYFQNAFLTLTETAPEESNSDTSLWFGVIKTNGQWRFYGMRWLGDVQIGNPNIGFRGSYVYDVGGFAQGENQQICHNFTRKASVGQTGQTIGCLDVANSRMQWDPVNGELIIDWKITFLPAFVSIRRDRRNLGSITTGVRKVNVYANVNDPLETLKDKTSVYTRYNWRELGSFTVGTPVNFMQVEPQTSQGDAQVFKTIITHPDSATDINEAYIWLDETAPVTSHSDVAVAFGMKREAGTYKFFGLRYSANGTTCTDPPYDLINEECFKNYAWDSGGLVPGVNERLFQNLNHAVTTEKTDFSTAFLSIADSKIYVNPQNDKELIVEWSIGFLKTLGNRDLKIYTRAIGTDLSGLWQEVGSHTVVNPQPDHGSVRVTADNRHLEFTDNTPYTWVGHNRYFIHRFLSRDEIDGYFAQMAMYHMNYLRIFTMQQNEMIEMLKTTADLAKKHGIYINVVVFSGNGSVFLDNETAPYRKSKDWVDYLLYELKDKNSVFMLDMVNDFNINHKPWLESILQYARSVNSANRLISFQPHTGVSLTDPNYASLGQYLDTYVVRAYGADPTTTTNDLVAHYNRELTVTPSKPVFIGETRTRGSGFVWTKDWQSRYQSIFDATTQGGIDKALTLGVNSVHPWVQDFRQEDIDLGRDLFPALSAVEWMAFLRFPPQLTVTDLNKDAITTVADLKSIIQTYATDDPFSDVSINNKVNVFDMGSVIKNIH